MSDHRPEPEIIPPDRTRPDWRRERTPPWVSVDAHGTRRIYVRQVGPLGIRVTIVEPGGMRTDWAGSSMRIDEIRDDYKATVGGFAQMARGNAGSGQSDPAKSAQAILAVVQRRVTAGYAPNSDLTQARAFLAANP